MTPAELKQFIAEGNKLLGLFVPSMEAASSDLLSVIMAAGMEFCHRYYPTAESAFFCIHFDRKSKRSMTSISIPVPAETVTVQNRE